MKLVVGLGNPGEKYLATRHNFGWLVIDKFFLRKGIEKWQENFSGLVAKNPDFILLKPLTFVNNSGVSVGELARFYRIAPEQIIVVHDDVDLVLGDIRLKQGGSSSGHHGVESVDTAIGLNYWRLRLGVGRPVSGQDLEPFVLGAFELSEMLTVQEVVDRSVTHLLKWLEDVPKES